MPVDAVVIGAGPAGLMAAEALAGAGRQVLVCEAKASPARKLLMAGKSGLNLTKAEALPALVGHYHEAADWLAPMLAAFGPDQVQAWCAGLGQPVFTGSSGRVFPVAMKASPLLRAWLARLAAAGVTLRSRWRWCGLDGRGLAFDTPEGRQVLRPRATVLALGGASWARLGSDAAWVPWLQAQGVEIAQFRPANMGFNVDWSAQMAPFFGVPVKGAALCVAGQRLRGEFVISAKGLEGGGIYGVSRALRDGATLALDLLSDLTEAEVAQRLARMRSGESTSNRLRKLGLAPAAVALLHEFGRPLSASRLGQLVKALPVPLLGPRPIGEAISVAGGVTRAAVSLGLELRALPGVYVCGEMLDWEAPTGGYLLTGCLATGRWAGQAAAKAAVIASS